MYEKDKKQRITLRLTEKQFSFVASQCAMLGINPSDYLRMLVNSVLFTAEQSKKGDINDVKPQDFAKAVMEDLGRENDKATEHHKL